MDNIRKQYEKRSRTCVLGTMEEPVEWAALGLGLKVSLRGDLCASECAVLMLGSITVRAL
jgi:hypothetical protein